MKILSTKDQEHQKIKCLIGGYSGVGKTTLAKTLDDKTLIISAESGLMAVSGQHIDYIDISKDDEGKTLTQPKDRIQRLSDVFKFLHAGTKYNCIFMDSLTEISELLVQKLQIEFPDRKDSFPMWGEYAKVMRSIVKNFRDLPYHVFMTCISKAEKDQNNKRFMAFDVAGSISERLPQYFNEVFYLAADAEGKRSILTKADDMHIHVRDRSNKLLPIEPPDLGAIVRKIIILEEKKEK